ncbi:AAA+ ATPase domain-containing protein [Tanacetum coccineum]
MTHWVGLLTKPDERILVLAATNRPFELDEAIIRRFERRIMVGLPSVENKGKILQTLLSKEHIEEGWNFSELATMTEGYTGSDLKMVSYLLQWDSVNLLFYELAVKKDSLWVNGFIRSIGPLINHVSHRKLYDAKFKEDMKVNEMVSDGKWNWPREWMEEFPAITGLPDPLMI